MKNRMITVLLLLLGKSSLLYAQQITAPPVLPRVKADTTLYPSPKEAAVEEEEEEGSVDIRISGEKKNLLFNQGKAIFQVRLKNTLRNRQEGRVWYTLQDNHGGFLREDSLPVSLKRGGSFKGRFTLPELKPGFYNIYFKVNLSEYDDTVHRVFGVQTAQVAADTARPAGFDAFWNTAKAELAQVQPAYQVTEEPKMEDKYHRVYQVEMKSIGNLTIRGWLTVPKIGKNYPVIYTLPGYVVEMKPNKDKDEVAVFSLNVRGNGNSRDVLQPDNSSYNLIGFDSPETYIYRAVYMDCIRGLDFLLSEGAKYRLNSRKIIIDGGSQGGALAIVLAGLDQRVKLLTLEVPIYANIKEALDITKIHPNEMGALKNFYHRPGVDPDSSLAQAVRLWQYFDPVKFAPAVHCPVLMGIGLLDRFAPPYCSVGLFNSLGSRQKELITFPAKAHEVEFSFFIYQNMWLMEKLGVAQ